MEDGGTRSRKLVIGLFGMVDSGKTTVAQALSEALWGATLLDAHMFRDFCGNHDYSQAGRETNIHKLSNLLDILDGNGVYILAFNLPTSDLRKILKDRQNIKFVHCSCSLETCQERDKKGLYARVGVDESVKLSGVNLPFDADGADMVVCTENPREMTPEGNARRCAQEIIDRFMLPQVAG